jgi:hypothetical protein
VLIQLNLLWLVYLAHLIVAWLGRLSEHQADRRAARRGYAEPLAPPSPPCTGPGAARDSNACSTSIRPWASRLQRSARPTRR